MENQIMELIQEKLKMNGMGYRDPEIKERGVRLIHSTDRIKCDCGASILAKNLDRHKLGAQKHKNYLAKLEKN